MGFVVLARHAVASVLIVSVAMLAAACGRGELAEGPAATADVAGATAEIVRFMVLPAFVPPGPAFDASRALRGKTIFEIPITSAVPFVTTVENGMRRAAEAVGARLVVYPDQGQPPQWARRHPHRDLAACRGDRAVRAGPCARRTPDRPSVAGRDSGDRRAHQRRGGVLPGRFARQASRHGLRPGAFRAGGSPRGRLGDPGHTRERRCPRDHLQGRSLDGAAHARSSQ